MSPEEGRAEPSANVRPRWLDESRHSSAGKNGTRELGSIEIVLICLEAVAAAVPIVLSN